jgi:hypothetical protein
MNLTANMYYFLRKISSIRHNLKDHTEIIILILDIFYRKQLRVLYTVGKLKYKIIF